MLDWNSAWGWGGGLDSLVFHDRSVESEGTACLCCGALVGGEWLGKPGARLRYTGRLSLPRKASSVETLNPA